MTGGLDRLWAGWRSEYIETVGHDESGCVLCRVIADGQHVVWRGERVAVILNAYPYTSGHVMGLPVPHVGEPEDLDGDEAAELWATGTGAGVAIKTAYRPGGVDFGAHPG